MNHKTVLRVLALVMVLALVLAACDNAEETSIPERPAVMLKVGDQVFEEPIYSYCWPESTTNVACDISADQLSQPSRIVDVASGEEIRFQITGDASTPTAITVTLLDGPGGVQDLGVSTEPAYTAALYPGLYRIRLDVQYDDVAGKQAYISYIFGLNVSGTEVAAAPTEAAPEPVLPVETALATEPAATPIPAMTEPAEQEAIPNIERTAEVTEPEATDEMMPEETEVAMALATEALEATAEPPAMTEEAMGEATEEAQAAVSRPVATEAAAAEAMATEAALMTPEATEPAVQEATPTIEMMATEVMELEATAEMTPEETEVAVALATEAMEATEEATAMLPEPTEDLGAILGATAEATEPAAMEATTEATEAPLMTAEATEMATEEVATVEATEEPATATPRPTLTPAPPPSPTALPSPTPAAPGPVELEIPIVTLTWAGAEYLPVGYEFCQVEPGGEHVCVNVPSSEKLPQRIMLLRGLNVTLEVSGEPPSSITVEYRSDEGLPTGSPETFEGENTLDLLITPEGGSYIMAVYVLWEEAAQDATYYFRITVFD